MALLEKVRGKFAELRERRHQFTLELEIARINKKERERANYYAQLKQNSTPVKGKIADIEYMDFANLLPDTFEWEPEDIIFWIKFNFEDGRDATLQYYHKGTGDPRPEQREILHYSGNPSVLEYATIGTDVIGYFQGDQLVALDNLAGQPA